MIMNIKQTLMNRIIIVCLTALMSLSCADVLTSSETKNVASRSAFEKPADSVLVKRIFPLLYVLNKDAISKKSVSKDSVLKTVAATWQQRLKSALNHCDNVICLTAELKLKDSEIKLIGDRLAILTGSGAITGQMINNLKATNAYFNYHQLSDSALVKNAWNDVAKGINRTIEVYLAGKKPRYPSIDSVSFNVNSPEFLSLVKSELRKLSKRTFQVVYDLPLETALKALAINGRDEAARYEPLTGGSNAAAFAAAQRTNWSEYPYTAILVPGYGPDKDGVKMDYRGVLRCKMAAERFKKGLAPFLIVSGGHVYPARTPFSEAVQMKKYMIEELGLRADAIIIEPHARHTTTNVRNAVRITYRFHMPEDKPVLVVTDSDQTNMVVNQAERCKRELGYVPFMDVKKLNEEESMFYPVKEAFRADINDPLDP